MDFLQKIQESSAKQAHAFYEMKRVENRVKWEFVKQYIPYSLEEFSKDDYKHLRFI